MKKQVLSLIAVLAVSFLAAVPVVSNVAAWQLVGQVLISYRLANPFELDCEVSVQVSADGGTTYTIFPTTLSGAVGLQPAPAIGANYEILWNYAEDGVGPGTNYRVKVLADDGAGVVAQPVFDPPGGDYGYPQSVSISCATNGATIRYTDDGSEPDEASAEYTGPIDVNSNTMLKAKGFKWGWTDSPTASAAYAFNMIYVPGGTFIMGDTIDDGAGYTYELPTHSVTLSSFYIGQYEVTQAEYSTIMGANPAHNYGVGDSNPVYFVSWYSTLKYCNLRSMAEGLTPCYTIGGSTDPANWGAVPATTTNATWDAAICDWSANGYRLPTEAEWEYAARSATNDPDYLYSGSNDINAVAWYSGNAGGSTHTVGTKDPNSIDTFDMSGNVYEWCWDWYSSSYYSSSPASNPTGPASGTYRVRRGGGWDVNAGHCRVAYRSYYHQFGGSSYDGFRVCRAMN